VVARQALQVPEKSFKKPQIQWATLMTKLLVHALQKNRVEVTGMVVQAEVYLLVYDAERAQRYCLRYRYLHTF